MGKTLLIFLFSDRVDSYINAIAYTYDNMEVKSVRLIYVKGTRTGLDNSQASNVFNQIWNRIERLSSEKNDIYTHINEYLLDRELIQLNYTSLKEGLKEVIKKQGGNENCIIDLTGASKSSSIDVFAVCLALGVDSAYTFELLTRPKPLNPEESLYHLLEKQAYSYHCVSNTDPVKNSQSDLLRKSSLLWYICVFSLSVMVVSLYILHTSGFENETIQSLNLAASIIGIASPILALIKQ